MNPRPYQSVAAERVVEEWRTHSSTLVVMATGLGKTFLASMLALAKMREGATLFLCHRKELVWQTVETFGRALGVTPEVEMGEYRAVMTNYEGAACPVVVSTFQTLYSGCNGKGRMTKFDPKKFSLIIVDEAHHGVSEAFMRVILYFVRGNPALRMLGITATPDRRDKLAMGQLFKSVAYRYDILDGINDGWLVPIDQWTGVLTNMDLSQVGVHAGDLDPKQLAAVMEQKKNLFGMAEQVLARVGDRKTLMFASSVKHAELLAAIFNDRMKEAGAEYIHADTPDEQRRDIIRRFYRRDFQFLCNVGICTEGYNDEGIEVVVCGRPTTSRALYTQMAGRGTRVLPGVVDAYEDAEDRKVAVAESSKPGLELIDFAGNAGKHQLVTGVDILGGRYESEVINRVKKASERGAVNITAELEAEWARVRAERRAAQEIEAKRLAEMKVEHQCSFEWVDPFSAAGSNAGAAKRKAKATRGSPASEGQLKFLTNCCPRGVDLNKLTVGQAGKLIDEIKRRRAGKLCSIDQAKVLHDKGLPVDVPRDTAKAWLDALSKNRWHVPPRIAEEAALYRQTKDSHETAST